MEKNKNWVNYAELKARISIQSVLEHYGLFDKLRPSGTNLVGCCPIHHGTSPRQFSVSLERNAFNCFGDCKGGGNIFDLVAKLEGVSLHQAAVLLNNWFPAASASPSQSKRAGKTTKPKTVTDKDELVREEKKVPETSPASPVNPPLTFELKKLNPVHPFFEARGILPETVAYFGLGLCPKGMLKDRLAIPIHNEHGELVAYCGRAVTEAQIEQEGKYKLPPNFHKSLVVYNLHRQQPDDSRPLIVVESYLSVWKLHQAGFPRAVSLMGSKLSEEQAERIFGLLGAAGHILLAFDNDEDGERCAVDCLTRLGKKLYVKAVDLGAVRKPHQLTEEQIQNLFT